MPFPHSFAKAFAVTPNDSNDLAQPCDALFVAAAGNIVCRNQIGQDITITSATVCSVIPFKVRRVLSTGTTATVVGLWGQ